jgi:hypothetical protein
MVAQIVKKFPMLDEKLMIIVILTRADHWTSFRVSTIQTTSPRTHTHIIYLRPILIYSKI